MLASLSMTLFNVFHALPGKFEILSPNIFDYQKQPPRGVLRKRYSENMQQIYRRTPMPKCDLNKVVLK